MAFNETDIKFQLWKNGLEVFTHRLARALGRSDIGRSTGSWIQAVFGGPLAGLLTGDAGKIAVASFLNISQLPTSVKTFMGKLGLDENAALDILNEIVDSGAKVALEEVGRTGEAISPGRLQEIAEQQANYAINATKAGAFQKLTADPRKVAVNLATLDDKKGGFTFEIHLANCRLCKQIQLQGKKGQPPPPKFLLPDAVDIETGEVGEYIDLGYPATQRNCCGQKAQGIIDAAKKGKIVKINLQQLLIRMAEGPHASEAQRVLDAFEAAPEARKSEIENILIQAVWDDTGTNDLLGYVRQSTKLGRIQLDILLTLLRRHLGLPDTIENRVERITAQAGATAARIKQELGGVADRIRAKGNEFEAQARMLRDE